MTPEEWEKLESAFEKAVDLEGEALAAFLAELQAGDPGLTAELRRMLAEDSTGDHKLVEPVADAAAALSSDDTDPWIGRQLGSYEVVRRIAVGGMGAVFLAKRVDAQFDHQVAIKIMSAQLLASDAVARFKTERQILANLNHPNIGKLIDGGTTDADLPYLVMEYIDGVPVDEYCDANKLSITKRLKLFQEICLAVDYAHRNLVVHRDLKPNNIIITHEGTAKLLDFGIAKLLEPGDSSNTLVETVEGMRAMTRSYASPEQVRGEPVSVATDVYSLGVLLYQLLTGQSPYGEAAGSVRDIEQAILETDPKRPSTVVSSAATGADEPTAAEIGAKRSSSPNRLKSKLSGDLDNIVLMTMRKEPERRYPSVRQLSDDIQHYLDHEPVRAHPASLRYRTRKFVQRNKLGVSLSVGSLLIITMLTAFYTVNVTHERNRARLEAATAERVSDFMLSLFETSDPTQSMGETITARSLLDTGALRIQQELADQPAIRAAMQDVMGGAYRGLGLYGPSQPLLDEALLIRRELFGELHPDVLETQMKLGELAVDKGEYQKAEQIFRHDLEMSRSLYGEDHRSTALAAQNLGWAIYEQGRPDEAIPLIESALDILRRVSPDGSFDEASILNSYGWMTLNVGEFETAELSLKRSIAMLRQTVGESHPILGTALNHLSYVYMDTGRWDEAEATIREGLGVTERVLGDQHPQYSRELTTLGWILEGKGQRAEAEALYRQSLAIDEASLEPGHNYIAMDKNNLAGALMGQGKYLEAAEMFRESLRLNQQALGTEHPESATATSNLATALAHLGAFAEAEALFREAHRIRAALYGEDHPFTIIALQGVARVKHTTGDFTAARELFEAVLQQRRAILEQDHPDVAMTLADYAKLLRDTGDIVDAEQMIRTSTEIYQSRFDDTHPSNTRTLFILATVLARTDEADSASELFEQAITQQRVLVSDTHPALATQLADYGEYLINNERTDEALPYLEEALLIRTTSLPEGHWQIGVSKSLLGDCRGKLGLDGAEVLLQQGLAELAASMGEADWRSLQAADRLAEYQQR